ncbi:hypothetical protein [Clostridium perfringens]|uniref:Uncharacterized protein n=1 Tax=Clostridium perfringens TaxID=1502 RepID=A0A8H9QY76_CLOPF|nr:hypothetical protein [Clostridium perfringens]MDU7977671.1 hypothetical protein [Clostridioides difficile]EGS5729374.1 hypothetical protein [Clostridium perfringens]EGT0014417.1 hypothetical protein [Clostridium perfringens]MBI6024932.1 hypothetical protein [Clostridium perfringens]MBI6048759.1 hypothetical protein [Clostridium perfringens]
MPKVICCESKDNILEIAIKDKYLSLKSLGLLFKLVNNENSITNRRKLKLETLDGDTSLASAFKELQKLGYLKVERNVIEQKGKIESFYKLGIFEI